MRRMRPNYLVDHRGSMHDAPADPRLVALARQHPGVARTLQDAEHALMLFHSRPLRGVRELTHPVREILPRSVVPLGSGIHVMYQNDKDDPHTRAPHKRVNDPNGVVGVVKDFIHKHDGFVLPTVYGAGKPARRAISTRALEIEWPDAVWWQGVYLGSKIRQGWSGHEIELKPRGWDLWAFPDGRTLFACSGEALCRGVVDGEPVRDLILLRGGSLHVGWRGIGG